MHYFPAFIKLDRQKVLIVGWGNIAYEKLQRLLDFTEAITVIAPDVSEAMHAKIAEKGLIFKQRKYRDGDVSGFAIVVVAVDDIALQAAIFEESKQHNCLCNAVDSVDYCDFIFPSYIKKDDLTIAISTSGASPAVAKHLKRYLMKALPSGLTAFLNEMKALRQSLPKGKERMRTLDKKAEAFFETLSE